MVNITRQMHKVEVHSCTCSIKRQYVLLATNRQVFNKDRHIVRHSICVLLLCAQVECKSVFYSNYIQTVSFMFY